jgi:hypothetical protein
LEAMRPVEAALAAEPALALTWILGPVIRLSLSGRGRCR